MTDDQRQARPGRTNPAAAVPARGGCRRGRGGDQGRGRRGGTGEQKRSTSGHGSMQATTGCQQATEPWQVAERLASTSVNEGDVRDTVRGQESVHGFGPVEP